MKKIHLQKARTQIARPNTIRDINKQIVLNYVRDRSPISRADIARETALQRSTVSAIVDDLQFDGLIEEIGEGSSTGGRKPTLLKLKTGIAAAIGVDITPLVTTIAVADLAGQILEKESFPTSPKIEYMEKKIISRVSHFAKQHQSKNIGVGISVPGIADFSTGKVLYVPFFHWSNWEIGKKITEHTGLQVIVDNDANAIALAELWFGREEIKKCRNFITVLVAEGIGTGIIFDGQVYRGERGAAGEFGHMIVGENSPIECSCGSHLCWEGYASEKAAVSRYQKFDKKLNSIEELVKRAQKGEKQAIEALRETARYIGIGISNLVVGFSPQAIVVSGIIVRVWDLIKDELLSLSRRSVRQELAATEIIASSLGDQPTNIGAVSLVLMQKFALTN